MAPTSTVCLWPVPLHIIWGISGHFMPWGHRDLQNSNLEYFGNKVSDLKMAITLVFLDLFKSFKRLKWSAWQGVSSCQFNLAMKISREQDGLRSGFDKPCHNSRDILRHCHNSRDVFCQGSNDMVISYIQVVSPRSWSTCVDWGGILRIQEGYIGGLHRWSSRGC